MSTTQAITVVGGVLPPSLIGHLQDGTLGSPESRAPGSYHLIGTESVRDASARAWSYLRGAWSAWREVDRGRVDRSAGTGPARDRWLLPLLRELGYGQVPAAGAGITLEGIDYPISHRWQHVPIHLLGPGVDLDRRNPGVAGAARAPQSMVQELLNRTDEHLWAILSNGTRLRLLRDSNALVGSTYVEFDLEAIFEGELYADWLVLFQLAHVSRVEVRAEDAGPAECWLEQWRGQAFDDGARALGRLEIGVERALRALGTGFLTNPANGWLVEALRSGEVSRHDYHRALLRLVYRVLFTFVAEDRGLLLDPASDPAARERYKAYFSTARLRRLSRVRAGGPHGDLWEAQLVVLKALGSEGLPALGLAPMGGVFAPDTRHVVPTGAPDEEDLLWGAGLANADLLSAVQSLAWIAMPNGRTQPVDYRHLGAEELGSVYEALLELDPTIDLDEGTFSVDRVVGNDRKTTGSYYTSPDLVSALLDTALDPVIDRAAPLGADAGAAEQALLELTICDPACGSGGFLVAAARRIAQRLAEVRAGDDTPTPELVQHAMRDVVGRCVYGVDLNDLAAELAKVSLWIEAMEPGKPLSFLDARIRTGNALIGTTPALLKRGVPDDAFKELDGDDKKVASETRKRNKAESGGQDLLFGGSVIDLAAWASERRDLLVPVDTIAEVDEQRAAWERLQTSAARKQRLIEANAWCAAFVWPLTSGGPLPPTAAVVRVLAGQAEAYADTVRVVEELTERFRFFHWHLEFPEVFLGRDEAGCDGWAGGFSCMLGNPPWERVKLQEQEFFAARDPEVAQAPNAAARRRLIKALETDDPALYGAYLDALREASGQSAFLRLSGRYPLNGRGDVNTYAVFTELFRSLTGPTGQSGVIAPTGIATDATTQYFFKELVATASLAALFDFENRKPLFAGVDSRFKFCLLTMTGRRETADAAAFAFFLHDPSEIAAKQFALTPEEITLLNPNTGTCPVFRTRRDAEITLDIYRRVPILIKEGDPDGNPWDISFMTMFHMSNDSHLFRTRDQLEAEGWTLQGNVFHRNGKQMLPLYEGKMIHHFDHRWATYERDGSVRNVTQAEKQDPSFAPFPRYWTLRSDAEEANGGALPDSFLGIRDITNSTNERTVLSAPFRAVAVGNNLPVIRGHQEVLHRLGAVLSTFVLDFVVRPKVGGVHLNFFIANQMPVLPPAAFDGQARWCATLALSDWIDGISAELNDTSYSLTLPERGSTPFAWNELRRSHLRAELDAGMFHLYGVERRDVEYIMETFAIVKSKDMAAHGEYRTKRLILEVYDAMQKAMDTGTEYQTILDPPPGHGPRHPAKES